MSVTTIRPDLRSLKCPPLLRALQTWLVWRFEQDPDDPKGKPRKVPFYASGSKRIGRQGTAEDRIQLVTFDAARAAAARKGMEGVGFCPLEGLGIVALDFDDCFENGELTPEVEKIAVGTYAEYSPSGNGVRMFFKGNLGNRKSHKRKGWPYGFEVFSTKGFVTLTGLLLPVTELCETEDVIAEVTPPVLALYEQRFGAKERDTRLLNYDTPPVGLTLSQVRRCLAVLDPGLPYDEWIEVGMALHHETRGEGFELWDEWSSSWGDYPGTESLRSHWDSMGHRSTGRVVTARSLVKKANDLGERILLSLASAEDFDEIADEKPTPEDSGDFEVIEASTGLAKRKRFQGLEVENFLMRPAPRWIIKGVLPDAELAVIFGEPGSGKSFIALDMAMAIALGVPWRGQRVKRAKVAYIIAEGAGAFGLRIRAFCQAHGIDPAQLRGWLLLIPDSPNLMEKGDVLDVSRRIREWSGKAGVGAVFIDTFAGTTAGANENSGEDMGKALFHCKGIKAATGALVALVHHCGKDAAKGARGWSGIKGAADTQLEVKRTPLGRLLKVDKQKDGDDGLSWGFELDVVAVDVDEDGDARTSCVVREIDGNPLQQRRKLGPTEQKVVAAFHAEIQATGHASALLERVIERALELEPPADATARKRAKFALKRSIKCICSDESTAYRLEHGKVYVD